VPRRELQQLLTDQPVVPQGHLEVLKEEAPAFRLEVSMEATWVLEGDLRAAHSEAQSRQVAILEGEDAQADHSGDRVAHSGAHLAVSKADHSGAHLAVSKADHSGAHLGDRADRLEAHLAVSKADQPVHLGDQLWRVQNWLPLLPRWFFPSTTRLVALLRLALV
jgi:hypothetical protein